MTTTTAAAFQAWATRHGLRVVRSDIYEVGTARLIRRKGAFIIEMTTQPTSGGIAVGYRYPAGVKPLSEADLLAFLAT